jgi:Flp pilus assembly protein TadB
VTFVSFQLKVAATATDQKAGQHVKTTRLVPVFVASIVFVGVVLWKISRLPVCK